MAAEEAGLTRMTANLTPRSKAALDHLVEAEFGANGTDAINRAVRVASDLVKAFESGGRVQVVYPDGDTVTLWLA